ncbi:MAG: hypothetical protein II625_09770 [Bacilli bacterium]|nr:hypothetical protein [Bacilli bacterium]
MKEALIKLLKVSSLISLLFVVSYVISVFMGIKDDKFTEMVYMIIIFYFGTQVGKTMNN